MKKFIRYLYEYQNGQRVQNVGFVKVEHSDDCEVVQIYGKGFPVAGNQELEVLLFYMMGEMPVGISMGKIKSTRPMFGYRLEYTPEDVGGREMYAAIDGIILLNDINGFRKWYAAVWDEKSVPVEQMVRREEILRQNQEAEQKEKDEAEPVTEELETEENETLEDGGAEEHGMSGDNEPEINGTPTPESRGSEAEAIEAELEVSETESEPSEAEPEASVEETESEAQLGPNEAEPESEAQPEPEEEHPEQEQTEQEPPEPEQADEREFTQIYKITRKDIAKLPRREWRLANNNFLLHGYYNYHHLVSFEKDDSCWLGVPGIYHPKEQKAADSFGFGQFMKPDEGEIDLTEEETNAEEDFGYWCRKVSAVIR